MNDLAVFLEAAARLHIVSVLANPTDMSCRAYCACGWRSQSQKWPYESERFDHLAGEVKLHLQEAKRFNFAGFDRRCSRFMQQPAVEFLRGVPMKKRKPSEVRA